MSRGAMKARGGAVAAFLVAAVLAATTTACGPSGKGAAASAETRAADAQSFEAFVQQVGIDMSEVPIAVRREWASAPKLGIDDCAVPGTHEGHRE